MDVKQTQWNIAWEKSAVQEVRHLALTAQDKGKMMTYSAPIF